MALSRMHKGIAALVVALIAVVALGYGGLRYLESGVVASIRTWAKETPPDMRVELGDVTYSLLNNRLVLSNVRADYLFMGRKTVTTVGRVEIDNPDAAFLEAMANPETPLKQPVVNVADKIAFTSASTGPDPEWRVAQGTYTKIRIDLAKLREVLASGFDAQKIPQLIALTSYASAESDGLSVTIKENSPVGVPFQLTVRSINVRDYTQGKLAQAVIADMAYTVNGSAVVKLAEMTMEGVTPPSDALMEELNALAPDASTEKTLDLLSRIVLAPEPLLKKFELKGVTSVVPQYPVSLARLTFTNPSTAPYACSLELEHLVLPAETDALQVIRMIDLKQIDLSSALSLTAPDTSGDFKSALSVTLAQLGTADFRLDGLLPPHFGKRLLEASRSTSSDEVLTVALDTFKIGRVELGYKDDGLLSRAAALAQSMLGMTPQQSLDYAQQFLENELVKDSENPDITKTYVTKILSALEKPGSLRLSFIAPKPLSGEEIEALPIPSPYESLDAVPGPLTLEAQVKALNK